MSYREQREVRAANERDRKLRFRQTHEAFVAVVRLLFSGPRHAKTTYADMARMLGVSRDCLTKNMAGTLLRENEMEMALKRIATIIKDEKWI